MNVVNLRQGASMDLTRVSLIAAATVLAACTDSPLAPAVLAPDRPSLDQASEGRGVLQRYVAIGTSISMGFASDGVFFGSQTFSWPAQLAGLGSRELTQPYIASPGCRPPLIAPLALNRRLDGSAALPFPTLCAPLVAGVTLPTQNVAISGARTVNALSTTPETTADPLYDRVLPPGATQVSAMEAQRPKFVSVELGAAEVLNAYLGLAIAGPPPAPILAPALWAPQYREVLDRVDAVPTVKHVVLVGLPTNPAAFPAMRFGHEIAAQAPFLAALKVAVQPDCATTSANNLIFVLLKLAPLIVQAATSPVPLPFSCADVPLPQDLVLTPADQMLVGAVLAQMNTVIAGEAEERGFAYFSLDALYANPAARPPFSVIGMMTTTTPFGPLLSLDGIHPSAAGNAILAQAAAAALNERYGLGIPVE
jgi:hypothetical protein